MTRGRRRSAWLALAVAADVLLGVDLASAAAPARMVDLPSQALASELSQLARVSGIELLFDRALVAQRRGSAVHGILTPEQALFLLLKGSGLSFRETSDGAFVISTGPSRTTNTTPAQPAKSSAEIGAVSEILVVARRSLNVDIPRSEDDIQPYQVATSEDISRSQAETLEDFLRTRLPDDTAFPSSIQEPGITSGSPVSQVNLRGLGIDQTLVLVDGRRLPTTFEQPDLNGLPLAAIDRIETLTSTAGGIYGPGATGGVLNVVLKRDYQGGELSLTSGETTRGDAPEWRLDGGFGLSKSQTGTQVMLAFNYAEDGGLTFGQRDFVQTAHSFSIERASGLSLPPVAAQVNVYGYSPLQLVPSLGGQLLNSTITHLPLDVALGGLANEAALLSTNSGSYDLSLSPDGQGSEQSLLTATRAGSIILSARQSIGAHVQAFVDLLYLQDKGIATEAAADTNNVSLPLGAKGNPFQNDVVVSFPTPGLSAKAETTTITERATAGLIANLPRSWTAEIDFAIGHASTLEQEPVPYSATVTPFSGSAAFTSSLAGHEPRYELFKLFDQLDDYNVRLAGPLFKAPGGSVTMTLLAESRIERPPSSESTDIDSIFYTLGPDLASDEPVTKQRVTSAYAEARAPLVAETSRWTFLRGLELQLAIRQDWTAQTAGQNVSDGISEGGITVTDVEHAVVARARTTAITAGLRVKPVDGLMLRTSFATGYLPSAPDPLVQTTTVAPSSPYGIGVIDPRRGGTYVGAESAVTLEDPGSPNPESVLARTVSVGLVLTRFWFPGLRVSIDYTRTETSQGLAFLTDNPEQYLLDAESIYPGRITREPLTPADAAKGYTGGAVTSINTGAINIASSIVDSVHMETSYVKSTVMGQFKLYGQATWEPDLRFHDDPSASYYEIAGYSDGPLKWRGNVGVDWERGPWTAGANAQIYSGYRVAAGTPDEGAVYNAIDLGLQQASHFPAQAYLDVLAGYRLRLSLGGGAERIVLCRLGIRNLFDSTPPLSVSQPLDLSPVGYSTYGDPRGRRFEISATAHF